MVRWYRLHSHLLGFFVCGAMRSNLVGSILGHSIDRTLNGIFQFTDIAWPGVLLQGLLGLWAEARENRALQFLGHGDREVFGKQ